MDLFEKEKIKIAQNAQPLAMRMRPRVLAEYIGQRHIIGPGKLLTRTLEVPRALRDANYAGAKQKYYIPTQMGYEKKIAERLKYLESLPAKN